jgi:5-methylcytosine-specific restriction enzyme A
MAGEGRRAPDWAWEEIVLACDLVVKNGWQQLGADNPQVIELSQLLQRMDIHPVEVRGGKFRNPNGVGHKTGDIVTARPGYPGVRKNGGRRTAEIAAQFDHDYESMHAMAESIRSIVAVGEPGDFSRDIGYENESEMEGRYLLRLHAYQERNPALRQKKINSVLAVGESLACEVCGFDFAQKYGARDKGYIECHHIEPLHVGGEKARSVKELALLCSNCHRMIHTKPPWPTPAELKEIIRQQAIWS